MSKKLVVSFLIALAICLSGCGSSQKEESIEEIPSEEVVNEEVVDAEVMSEETVKEEVDNTNVAILEDTVLTEAEQSLTGIWEAEDGCLLAIRERNHDADEDDYFELDVMQYTTRISEEYAQEQGVDGIWTKITREDGSSFVEEEGSYQIRDEHMCPTDNEGGYGLATYVITYDVEGDFMTLTYDSPQLMDLGTYYRTDREISEADWAYYYEFNPDRQP